MDKEEFLASGLLEQYALGLTSEEETRLVEHFIDHYPDIRAKMNALQEAVEEYASRYAVSPPRRLKRRILSEILEDENAEMEENPEDAAALGSAAKASSSNVHHAPTANRTLFKGLFSILLIALIFIGFLLWQQHQLQADKKMLLGELANSRTENSTLQKERSIFQNIFDFIENGNVHIVHLWGSDASRDAHAVVYWNPKPKESYIKLIKMPALPSGKQFQLWADVDSTMVSAGLLDEMNHNPQVVQFIPTADSLNITIEPLGGSEQPSVLLLVAKGALEQDVN